MPRRDKGAQAKAREAAESARPYVQRLIEDDDLRTNLRDAYDAARDAYERATDSKSPRDALEDRKLQKDLKSAAEALRSASDALREPEKRDSGHGFAKLLVIAFIGAVLALALSEDLRKAALDRLFGAEEEFEYTSTTSTSASPSPTG
jgi:hypothetical protein